MAGYCSKVHMDVVAFTETWVDATLQARGVGTATLAACDA